MKASQNFDDLVKLVKTLREECPWDRKQTHESLKDHLIEEAYETIEAIDDQNFEELKKELGDVLLQVVFHSRMAQEQGAFAFDDVANAISEKMIRRHPHVFGPEEQRTSAEQNQAGGSPSAAPAAQDSRSAEDSESTGG